MQTTRLEIRYLLFDQPPWWMRNHTLEVYGENQLTNIYFSRVCNDPPIWEVGIAIGYLIGGGRRWCADQELGILFKIRMYKEMDEDTWSIIAHLWRSGQKHRLTSEEITELANPPGLPLDPADVAGYDE